MNDLGKIPKLIVGALQYVHEASWLHNDMEKNVIMHKSAMGLKPVLIDFGKPRLRGNQWIVPEGIAGTDPQSQEVIYSLKGYFQMYVRQICSVQLSDAKSFWQAYRLSAKSQDFSRTPRLCVIYNHQGVQ